MGSRQNTRAVRSTQTFAAGHPLASPCARVTRRWRAPRQEAFAQVPTIPLGQFYIRSAYRADLKNMPEGQAPFF
jgi:hypothetical protein